MSRRRLIVIVLGLPWMGCAPALEGVGAGATASLDAARCTALASALGLGLQVHPSDHFLLLASTDGASEAVTARLLDEAHNRFYDSFARAGFALTPAPDRLVCVCFDSYGQLEAYGRSADRTEASWMDGYYSYRTNRVAVVRAGGAEANQAALSAAASAGQAALYSDPSRGPADGGLSSRTTTHELAHQLAFNSGLQKRNVNYPFWLTEGLATNFEADSPASCGLEQTDSRYCPRLADAKAGGALIPLERFVGMTVLSAGQPLSTRDAYAQAWGLFHFLLRHYPAQLREYMADLAGSWGRQDSQSLRGRFLAAFGPLPALEQDFLRFIDNPTP